jgi:hypothetical protein
MGGRRSASNESLGALAFNPAFIAEASGNQISFATEFFKDGLQVAARAGNVRGLTDTTKQVGVVPAFGWMMRHPQKKLALGFGLLGVAGFRTDYQQDSSNVLMLPQPDGSAASTDYSLTDRWRSACPGDPKLSVGGSLNVYRAALDPAAAGRGAGSRADGLISCRQPRPRRRASATERRICGRRHGVDRRVVQQLPEVQVRMELDGCQPGVIHAALPRSEHQVGWPTTVVRRRPETERQTMVAIGRWMKFDNVEGLGGPGGVNVEAPARGSGGGTSGRSAGVQ